MLNNKGFTIAEILVSFTLITMILLSIIGSTIFYRDKLKEEEVKSQLVDFKNSITKILYDDIINEEIDHVETCLGVSNCVNLIGKDNVSHTLKIIEVYESSDTQKRGVYLSYDGLKYFLPDSDLMGRDSAGNIVKTCDFINGIRVNYYNDMYTIKMTMDHANYDYQSDIIVTMMGGKDEYIYNPPTIPVILLSDTVVNLNYGGTSKDVTYVYSGDGAVFCTSSDESKVQCTVNSKTKKVTVIPVGLTNTGVNITVSARASSNYYVPDPVSFIVNVYKKTPTLVMANENVNTTYGTNTSNGYTYDGDGNVSCSSSDTSKVTCSVDTTNKKITIVPKSATASAVTITVSSSETNEYFASVPATFKINIGAKVLVANTPSCSDKTYNGNTTASCTITYSNVESGDSVTGGATCTFANKNVGTNKTVTCTSFTKSGTGNANYTVPSGSKTTTANITAKTLMANTPSCSDKTYNGNTTASCTISYSNVESDDSVTGGATCTFADANAGTNKTVTCSSFTKSGTGNENYTVPSGSKTTTANITAQTCNAPTGVSISTAGKVTWTASSNCSGGQHQVSINNSNWTNASSGVDYKSTIIASTGTRTVYVRAVAPSSNYSTSRSGSASTTVYSVSLTKGTGVSSVTGAGNYIKGSTATINATMASHYIWSKWTGTPATSTQKYSAAVNGNWSATANATNLCASTKDNPLCDKEYGSCSVSCSDQTGTKTRSCTHRYYSTVPGYTSHLCNTGITYTDETSCTGTQSCGSWHYRFAHSSAGECGGSCRGYCNQQNHTTTWSCIASYTSRPSAAGSTSGKYCWCKY